MKKIRLNTYDNNKLFELELLYKVQLHYTFDMSVKSGYFSWKSSICILWKDLYELKMFLEEAVITLNWSFRLKDNDSDSTILFTLSKWKVNIEWQVWWSHQDHFMKFIFDTDQTVLRPFYLQLSSLLESKD